MARLLVLVSLVAGFAGGALAVFKPWEPSLVVTDVYAIPLEAASNADARVVAGAPLEAEKGPDAGPGVDAGSSINLGAAIDSANVFLKIQNPGATPDRLLDVRLAPMSQERSASARWIPTDRTPIDMADLGQVAVPALTEISLAPDSAHIRLEQLPLSQMTPGALIPLDLIFERAGRLRVKARMAELTSEGAVADGGQRLFGAADLCRVGDGEPAPEITVSARRQKTGYLIEVESNEFDFTPHLLDKDHIPGTGHGHVYINGAKLGRLFQSTMQIGALPRGEHQISVTLNTNDHRLYLVDDKPVEASLRLTVEAR